MLANSKPLSLGLRNLISIAFLIRRLNVLLSVARTFVLLEPTSLGFGRGSGVEGTKSRVEGNMSRVLKNENKIIKIKIKKNKK